MEEVPLEDHQGKVGASHKAEAAARHGGVAALAVAVRHLGEGEGHPDDAGAACGEVAFAYVEVDKAYEAVGACQVQVGKDLQGVDLLGKVAAWVHQDGRHEVGHMAYLEEVGPSCQEEACLCPCPC